MASVTWGRVVDGAACYVHPSVLSDVLRSSPHYTQATKLRGRIASLWIPKTKTKVVDQSAFGNENEWGETMDDCARFGVRAPSSYGSIFHAIYRGPHCPSWVNRRLRPFFYGGWQWCRSGAVNSRLYCYDLVSAYAWAGMRPLPDPKSVWYTDRLSPGGIAICDFYLPDSGYYPYPLRPGRNLYPMTAEDLELYGARWFRVIRGMRFDRTVDLRPELERIVNGFRMFKKVLRTYWGAWGATDPITCEGWRGGHQQKAWAMPPRNQNFLWANLITRRVKAKVWKDSGGNAVHVYVDSVIVPRKLPTGASIGSWKLVAEHRKGLVFFHPGAYKDKRGKWVKKSGIAG